MAGRECEKEYTGQGGKENPCHGCAFLEMCGIRVNVVQDAPSPA